LVPGMSLSSGSAVGANAWQVPATDLANTWIGPPQNFAGEVELIAELHLADATIAHRQSVHIEWIAATAAGPEQASVVPIPSSPADSEPVPITAGPAIPEQVSVAAKPPKAVAASQELDQDEIAMKGSEDPPARNEQQAASSHEKRAARSQGTAPTRNKEDAQASARQRALNAPAYVDHPHDVRQRSQRTRARDDQDSGREFIDADGFRHIILPRRPSEPNEDIPAVKQVVGGGFPASEVADLISQDGMRVAAVPATKVTQETSDESAPERTRESQCDYRACARAHRSFRASDCTYRPIGGRRRLCEKGAPPTDVPERASQVSTQTRAQCNLDVCARFYRSFDPSDCTYQPNSGGARRTCDR
jgi:hypothetical protein